MSKEDHILTLLRKQVGEAAKAVLDKIEQMQNEHKTRKEIEEALAADLYTHMKGQLEANVQGVSKVKAPCR